MHYDDFTDVGYGGGDYDHDYDLHYYNYSTDEVHFDSGPPPTDYVHLGFVVVLFLVGVAVNAVATTRLAREEKSNFVFYLRTTSALAFVVLPLTLTHYLVPAILQDQTTVFPFLLAYLFYPAGVFVAILLQMVIVLMGVDTLRSSNSDAKSGPGCPLCCVTAVAALMSIPSWFTFSVIQTGYGSCEIIVRETLLNSFGGALLVLMAMLPPTVALIVLVALVAFRRRKEEVGRAML